MESLNSFTRENKEIYQLSNKDEVLLEFVDTKKLRDRFQIYLLSNKLPIVMRDDVDLDNWINKRVIPTNREHLEKVLESLEKSNSDKFEILCINHACSLNDTFWIKKKSENLIFNDVSLYNGFKDSLGIVSFFGNTSSLGGNLKTPETTTQGMLSKAWRLVDDNIWLYKSGTRGYANAGKEIYSEYIASQISKILGFNYVDYELTTWNEVHCTRCKLFTSEEIGFLSMSDYLNSKIGGSKSWTYKKVLEELPTDFIEGLNDIVFFDYLIENKDRHFSNFGLLIDNDTQRVLNLAPIFDNGFSLLNFYLDSELQTYKPEISEIGTFGLSNLNQGLSVVEENKKRYKLLARKLLNNLDSINMSNLSTVRKNAILSLLKDRCKRVLEL